MVTNYKLSSFDQSSENSIKMNSAHVKQQNIVGGILISGNLFLINLVKTFRDMVVALSDIIVIISKEMAAASSRNYSPATQKKERKI